MWSFPAVRSRFCRQVLTWHKSPKFIVLVFIVIESNRFTDSATPPLFLQVVEIFIIRIGDFNSNFTRLSSQSLNIQLWP